MKTTLNKGFTLIEMSIVMLILAFLSGGILIGREIIYSAEIRATIKQTDMFSLAYNTFRLKYNCIPGDCPNATDFGFTGGFTINLSLDDTAAKSNLLNTLNPVSDAYAVMLPEFHISVDETLSNDSSGGATGHHQSGSGQDSSLLDNFLNPPTGESTDPGVPIVANVPLNGNGDSKLETDNGQYEGPIGYGILYQAGMINQYILNEGRVYLPLSDAGATVGSGASSTFKKAFWVTSYLNVSENGIIPHPGMYLQPIASFLPFSAAALTAMSMQIIDTKIDDGAPLTGTTLANSNANLNLSEGPILKLDRDIGLANSCLRYDEKRNIIYNIAQATGAAFSDISRCAVVIALNI
jgi:prepilin-type N-terminal cleavage/methylation domain-containing protein